MIQFWLKTILYFMLGSICLNSSAQKDPPGNNCKVLVDNISESYSGECKKGLAHGEGKAEGNDSYVGKFKKGYPHGKGIYTWANGNTFDGEWLKGKKNGFGTFTYKLANTDSIVKGYWEKDKYIGIYKNEYEVNKTYNIPRYKIQYIGGANDEITINFYIDNRPIMPQNINLAGNIGSVRTLVSYIKVQSIIYPYNGKLTYKIPSKLASNTYDCIFEFEIFRKGSWKISIYH